MVSARNSSAIVRKSCSLHDLRRSGLLIVSRSITRFAFGRDRETPDGEQCSPVRSTDRAEPLLVDVGTYSILAEAPEFEDPGDKRPTRSHPHSAAGRPSLHRREALHRVVDQRGKGPRTPKEALAKITPGPFHDPWKHETGLERARAGQQVLRPERIRTY